MRATQERFVASTVLSSAPFLTKAETKAVELVLDDKPHCPVLGGGLSHLQGAVCVGKQVDRL